MAISTQPCRLWPNWCAGEAVFYYATDLFRAKIEATGAVYRSYGPQASFERKLGYGGMLGGMAGLIEAAEEILPDVLSQVRDDQPDYCLLRRTA
ncbi:MAG: hypothetical protein R3E79_05060 [Caldilineaceae bacterium]